MQDSKEYVYLTAHLRHPELKPMTPDEVQALANEMTDALIDIAERHGMLLSASAGGVNDADL